MQDREYVAFIHNKTDTFDGVNVHCVLNKNTMFVVNRLVEEAAAITAEYVEKRTNEKVCPECIEKFIFGGFNHGKN
jgi:hypothetical protein